MSSGDHVAMTMLAMAETLRLLQPPKVKMAIKCAKGALTLSLSPEMTAHVRFQLGKLYFFYTENLDLALQALESSEVNTLEGRAEDALEACQVAIQHCVDDPVVNLYFRLTRNMVSARLSGAVCDESETMIIGQLINRLDQTSPATANLKLFYICTLLAFMLADGKCNYERAAKYYTIAVRHIQDYNARASRNPCEYGILRSVQRMRMALNEMMAQCNIMACHPSMAMDNIRDMVQYSHRHGAALFEEFAPAIQSLLGHYCSYLREPEAAEKHFLAATKYKSCKDKNMWVMTHVNLAITYLAQCKHAEFYEIADQLTPNRISSCSLIVKNNAQFLHAFHAYLLNKINECRTLIAECMETAKTEDLFRLHGLSVLLFSIFVPVNAEVNSS
ncbi:unnamed protein product [Nippostrongylus brasiliensis]|uniref:MAU2 chromatid cohesion factor homolog n=1 Tax=Nippostrongylus brasiliensis TaxID=27835 RepID=A0A0N4YTG5_NIPBR|nr:unnamed protein product [Nippostrongylus brasiliensis]